MITGRDIAKFVTKVTGNDYLSMYDEGQELQNEMKMETKNKFVNIFNRMNEVAKRNANDIID